MVTIGLRKGESQGVNSRKFWKKCNYAKMGCPIKTISKFFAAKVITNIVLKFSDNRLKGREVTGVEFGGKLGKSLITQKRDGQSR